MTDANLNREPLEWLATAFKQVDWLVPAFIPLGLLNQIASEIRNAPDSIKKQTVFRDRLSLIYDEDYFAVMYLHKYSNVRYVSDFKPQLGEAIEAYFLGLKHAALTAMIPILEGTMRGIAQSQGRDVGMGTKGLLIEFDELVERERNSTNCYGERMVMLETLRDFIKGRFLESTKTYVGQDEFNRHGILHGVFKTYGDDLNFFRAITILDLMCFSIGLLFGGVSLFVPNATAESQSLAKYYMKLRTVRDSN